MSAMYFGMSPHKLVSFIKSGVRLIGCLGPGLAIGQGIEFGLAWFAGWFAAAECLGIVEEIGEP